ncbi:MAG TPA: hypothetical protein VHY35_01010 [Stellaceae bacterium]|jgi:hypothetical protein|nr:hypothetical protein [Stellaceae bacterium]
MRKTKQTEALDVLLDTFADAKRLRQSYVEVLEAAETPCLSAGAAAALEEEAA